jgi:hypothetical protein
MNMGIVNRVDLQYAFHNFTRYMQRIAVKSFASYQITIKAPIIHMSFDKFTNRNSVFNILKTNLPIATLIAGVSREAIVVGF